MASAARHPALDQLGKTLVGKTFLDIGARSEALCRAALERGCERAVALLPGTVSVAAAPGRPEIVAAELEDWTSSEQFDVVHCHSLHEMYDPIHALRRMVDLARGTIVLEIAAPRRDGGVRFPTFTGLLLRKWPALVLGAPRENTDTAEHVFAIAPEALRVFFEKHYACFMPATVSRSAHQTFVRADFREIDTLTIIAGATSSGKSTLMERLCKDAALRQQFDLPHITVTASARTLRALPARALDHVLFHYDLLRPFARPLRSYARDPALSLMRAAKRVNILTIMTPQQRLLAQLEENELAGKKPSARHLELFRRYQVPGFLDEWHRAWFAFCQAKAVSRHDIVVNDENYRLLPASVGMKHSDCSPD
jgi:hypothetical protein